MQAQLAALTADFESAIRRLDALDRSLATSGWERRPSPQSWSAIECVQHLNLTGEATLPRVREGIAAAKATAGRAPARYRRDLWGWLLWRGLRQPGRFRT